MDNNLLNDILEHISKGTRKALNEAEQSSIDYAENDDFSIIDYIFDLSDLIKTKEDLISDCILPLRTHSEMSGFSGPFRVTGDTIKKINESATRTYPYEELIKYYRNKIGVQPGFIKAEIHANKIETIVLFVNLHDNLDFVKDAMSQFGWSYSCKYNTVYFGVPLIAVSFDPMFQDSVNEEIIKNPLLFHWTPDYLYPVIMKEGLKSKSENYNFSYPPKIHLLKGTISEDECNNIGELLCDANKDSRNNGNYVLLNIDTTKIPYAIDYFYDPRYEFGYYTKQDIPVIAISKKLKRLFK